MKDWNGARSSLAMSLLIMTGVALAGCGQQGVPVGATPVSTAIASVAALPGAVGTAVGQRGVGPVPTGGVPLTIPGAQATIQGSVAVATAQQATHVAYELNWVDRLKLNGSDPEAEAVLKRWQNALRGLKSISGSQVFMQIEPDGTRHALDSDKITNWDAQGTEERYAEIDRGSEGGRYYVALHMPTGDLITSYDGKDAYRTWTWMENDVFRPLPDRSAKNAYWADDIDDMAFANKLVPKPSVYSFVGRREIDGRAVAELVVKSGNSGDGGSTGTHVFLDEQTNLPYRIVIYPTGGGSKKLPAFETTFTRVQINPPLSDAEFRPAMGPDTWSVYEPVNARWSGYDLPVYGSVEEAEKAAGTPIFAPGGKSIGEVPTWGFVEKSSGRKAVISLENGTILEGLHLPQVTNGGYRFSGRASTRLGEYETTKVEVGGIAAEVWAELGGKVVRLRMVREGTQIEITASSKEKALEVAASLQPAR